MNIRSIALVTALVLAVPALALAQAPPQTKAPVVPKTEHGATDPCVNKGATVGQGGDIDVKNKPQGKTLSYKLAQSNGVICPPPTADPGIKQPTPPAGNMPVLPPPGAPGGNPDVQPK